MIQCRGESRLTKQIELDAYQTDGFMVVRDAIPLDQIAILIAVIERIQNNVATLPSPLRDLLVFERDLNDDRRGHASAMPVGDAIFILGDPPRFDAAFGDLLRSPTLRTVAEALLGTADLVTHFMNVTIKQPCFGRSIGWHRDFPNEYICTVRPRCIRIMICLDGMYEESGATSFLPGSHLLDSIAVPTAQSAGLLRTVRCNAGDLVVIHPKVLHGGSGNSSARWRRNVIVQIGAAGEPLATDTFESTTNHPLPTLRSLLT